MPFSDRTTRTRPRQLGAAGLAPPYALPRPLDSFVGRETEWSTLASLLADHRLVTVYGPGGVGKSRLVTEVAAGTADRYRHGIVLVGLGALARPELVARTVADALGVYEEPGVDLVTTIGRRLDGRPALVILDNCEHLVDACAAFARNLLQRCSGPRLLVTTREVLRVPGEVAFRVDPLPVPPGTGSAAVRLFVDRARAVRPDFTLTADNAPVVAAICAKLDGLPLAVELAAGWVRLLAVPEILGLLGDRFALLDLPSRPGPAGGRSLRSVIGRSYQLLQPAERVVFRRLAVLAGGFDLATAAAVAADGGPDRVPPARMLALLAGLEAKSLITPVTVAGGTRFHQLESVRLYAEEQLLAAGEYDDCRRRLVDRFHGLVQADAASDVTGRSPAYAADESNLHLAVRWTGAAGDGRRVRLADALATIWRAHGRHSQGRALLAGVLDRPDGSPLDRARATITASALAFDEADYPEAARLAADAERAARSLDEPGLLARALDAHGVALANRGAYAAAEACLRESAELWHGMGRPGCAALARQQVANCRLEVGDLAGAAATLAAIEPTVRGLDRPATLVAFLHTVGTVALRRGDRHRAGTAFTEMVRRYAEHPDELNAAMLACGLEGLMLHAAGGDDATPARPDRALWLAGAAEAARERSGTRPERRWRRDITWAVTACRAAVRRPDELRAQGRAWTPEQAIGYALDASTAAAGAEPPDGAPAALLTEREREIAQLIARGDTNPQIARHLSISTRTVDTHVDHIRDKLAVRSRARIAVWAARHLGPAVPADGGPPPVPADGGPPPVPADGGPPPVSADGDPPADPAVCQPARRRYAGPREAA